jgi:hypothetical protein
MNRKLTIAAALAVAVVGAGLRVADAQLAANGPYRYFDQTADHTLVQREREFALQNKTFMKESTSMPAGSPRVNTSIPAADALRPVTTEAGEVARFQSMNHALVEASTAMPSGSPAVNRREPAADALPKATNPQQHTKYAAAEERFLDRHSTR